MLHVSQYIKEDSGAGTELGRRESCLSLRPQKWVFCIFASELLRSRWTDSGGRNVTHEFETLVIGPQIMSHEEKVTKGFFVFVLFCAAPINAGTDLSSLSFSSAMDTGRAACPSVLAPSPRAGSCQLSWTVDPLIMHVTGVLSLQSLWVTE